MEVIGPVAPRAALAIYLQDHHAGAQVGLALARRAAAGMRGTPAAPVLERVAREIEEDEGVLLRVLEQVGGRPSPLKTLGARLAERLGRFKLNGQLLGRSPLTPVVELEALLLGIEAKRHLWILLRDTAAVPTEGVDPARMLARADDQLDRLREVWLEAARAAFPDDVGSDDH